MEIATRAAAEYVQIVMENGAVGAVAEELDFAADTGNGSLACGEIWWEVMETISQLPGVDMGDDEGTQTELWGTADAATEIVAVAIRAIMADRGAMKANT